MGRKRSEELVEADAPEFEYVEEPIVPAAKAEQPKTEVKPKEYTISEDPYLTDEQKDVLFAYEFKKRVSQIQVWGASIINGSVHMPKSTLIRDKNGQNWLVLAGGEGVKIAWEYYNKHIQGGSVENFVAHLRETLKNEKICAISVDVIDMYQE